MPEGNCLSATHAWGWFRIMIRRGYDTSHRGRISRLPSSFFSFFSRSQTPVWECLPRNSVSRSRRVQERVHSAPDCQARNRVSCGVRSRTEEFGNEGNESYSGLSRLFPRPITSWRRRQRCQRTNAVTRMPRPVPAASAPCAAHTSTMSAPLHRQAAKLRATSEHAKARISPIFHPPPRYGLQQGQACLTRNPDTERDHARTI